MNIKDLKPASALAANYGVKALCYGAPGTHKTPLLHTAPKPVLLATEPGLKSLRHSNIPTWEAYNAARIDEFFKWLRTSKEISQFDTICIDSVSQLAEIVVAEKLKAVKHGQKAFGEANTQVLEWLSELYFLPQKHVFMIAKEANVSSEVFAVQNGIPSQQTIVRKVPYFPGKELPIKIPHQYDEILHSCYAIIPGVGETIALRTRGNNEILARDRSGSLNEFEPHDLTALFAKCMG